MKRFLLFLFIILSAASLQAQNYVVVDPNAELRTLEGSFSSIKVSGGIDIYLSQSDNEAIAVSAIEERFRQEIKTRVENGVLRISYEGDKLFGGMRNKKLKAYISFKSISRIEASGACDVRVSGKIDVASLDLILSGASDFKGAVKVNDLVMNLSGSSDVKISGTANSVKIESSGSSDVNGYDLVTDLCTASASGASDINITVNRELNASASGSSYIFYKGAGVVKEVHSSGSSSIARKS